MSEEKLAKFQQEFLTVLKDGPEASTYLKHAAKRSLSENVAHSRGSMLSYQRNRMIGQAARWQGFLRLHFSVIVVGVATLLNSCNVVCQNPSETSSLKHLETHQAVVVCVPARSKWTSAGILIRRGETYDFQSTPPDRWYDFFVPSTAAGYKSLPFQSHFESRRRVPSAQWFALS
jgi:hypothetical protein